MQTYEQMTLRDLPQGWRPCFEQLLEVITDPVLRLFIFKCAPSYPEYRWRLHVAKRRAINEAGIKKLDEKRTQYHVEYRRELAMEEIKRDRLEALEILLARLQRYKKEADKIEPMLFMEFTRLVKHT